MGENPVKASIPCFLWTKAIDEPRQVSALNSGLKGKDRLNVPIKFLWNYASNTLINQHSDINRTKSILRDDTKCEMIVVVDAVMTASARFADIILPATTSFEENDLCYQSYAMELGVLILRQQAIEPAGESRRIYDICAGAGPARWARKRSFARAAAMTTGWEHLYAQCRKVKPELPPDYAEAVKTGLFKWARDGEPHIGLGQIPPGPQRKTPLPPPPAK